MNAPVPMFSEEAEYSVLGSLLMDNDAIDFIGDLKPEHFFVEDHRMLFAAIVRMIMAGRGCDVLTLSEELHDRNDGENWLPILGSMVANTPSAKSIGRYARIVIDRATERELLNVARDIAVLAESKIPTAEKVDKAQSSVMALADSATTREGRHIGSIINDVVQAVEDGHAGNVVRNLTHFTDIDAKADILTPGDLIIVAGRPAMGKAQPVDANIKTIDGWKRIGEIAVGDEIASIDGGRSVVEGVFPQGIKQIYEVRFSDGRMAECCEDHLWRVMYRDWNAPRVIDTKKLIQMLSCVRYRSRLWIDSLSGDFGADNNLPISPWALGAMLGDGTFSKSNNSGRFSTKSPELVDRMNLALSPLDVELVFVSGYDWRIVGKRVENGRGGYSFEENRYRTAIKSLGLFGLLSDEKFIPKRYMLASKESRIALLQGILDTDGWIEKWGSIRFSSASKRLASDVATLVRSLGGYCSMSEKKTSFSYGGEKKVGVTAYSLCISMNSEIVPFTLREKMVRVRADWSSTRRVVFSSITPSRMEQAVCIKVSHPTHTYITDNYVVTHNTTFVMNIAERQAENKAVVVFSQEMSDKQLGIKTVASIGKIELDKLTRNQAALTDEDFDRMSVAVKKISELNLHVDDQPARSLHQIRSYCRSVRRKHGPLGLVVIDYLQLMSADADSRHEEIASISRGLKVLAKELEVPVIALSQLNRGLELRPNKRPVMSDLRESGQIEQDADVIMFIYRDEVYNPDTPDKGVAEIIFGKVRMGQLGTVGMSFLGQFSRFENLCREWAPYVPEKKTFAKKGFPA